MKTKKKKKKSTDDIHDDHNKSTNINKSYHLPTSGKVGHR